MILRHAVRVNGLTGLAINKLDTLSDIGKLKICVAYKKNDGTILNDYPASLEELAPVSYTHLYWLVDMIVNIG